jgi:thiol-disulfide isomerase/thioredoxin
LGLIVEDFVKFGIKCQDKGKLIVVISSKWCSSCKHLSLILKKLRDERLFDVLEIDFDKYPSVNNILNLTAVPALLFFKDGKLINKDIEINGFPFVKNGMMIGINCESILREIIEHI